MKTIEQKLEQRREWQKAARERAIARQREKLADPAWRESQYQKMRDSIDRRIAKQKERPPASKTRKSAVKIKSRGLKGRTPTEEEQTIANALGTLPCIACYMHGVIVSAPYLRSYRAGLSQKAIAPLQMAPPACSTG